MRPAPEANGGERALSANSPTDKQTLHTLLARRAAFLSFVQRRVSDRELAEDILQAAYMRALERTGALREDDSAVAWFYSVLRNAVIDHYRRRASEASALNKFAVALGDPFVPSPDTHAFVCGCIEHVLPTLRPAYAEILREVDLDEASLADFATRHKLTPGNAAVRIHRARTRLRDELARFCGACTLHACMNCICKVPIAEGRGSTANPATATS